MLKKIIKEIIPPFLLRLWSKNKTEYKGSYGSFEEAKKDSTGYDTESVFEKVRVARLKVERGEAVYERDAALFDKIQIFWPLLSSLLWVALKNNSNLNVLDIGGSLGSTYFQNEKHLKHLNLSWNILEQKRFVDFGSEHFRNHKHLRFFYNLKNGLERSPTTALFSSSLQYMEEPYEMLTKICDSKIPYVLFDRTIVFEKETKDKVVLQHAYKKSFTETSFPAWIFGEEKLIKFFKEKGYNLLDSWYSIGDPVSTDTSNARNKGYLFEKI